MKYWKIYSNQEVKITDCVLCEFLSHTRQISCSDSCRAGKAQRNGLCLAAVAGLMVLAWQGVGLELLQRIWEVACS